MRELAERWSVASHVGRRAAPGSDGPGQESDGHAGHQPLLEEPGHVALVVVGGSPLGLMAVVSTDVVVDGGGAVIPPGPGRRQVVERDPGAHLEAGGGDEPSNAVRVGKWLPAGSSTAWSPAAR